MPFRLNKVQNQLRGIMPEGGDKVGQTNVPYLCSGSIPVLVIIVVGPEGLSLLRASSHSFLRVDRSGETRTRVSSSNQQ
jgi:hypothetical protein